jgi:hypothetical protein
MTSDDRWRQRAERWGLMPATRLRVPLIISGGTDGVDVLEEEIVGERARDERVREAEDPTRRY